MNIREYPSTQTMACAMADDLLLMAEQAIQKRGGFHLVLAGGTSPRLCYEQLRERETEWTHWHIYFGDERCLPVGDDERNDHMADLVLLNHVPIPASNIHRIPAELGAEEGAAIYAETLGAVKLFDCVLLGMGQDGHTASLFPNNAALRQQNSVVPVYHAPKPPSNRISLSFTRINQSRQRVIMVAGANKENAWRDVKAGMPLPVTQIHQPLWLHTNN